ncbi:ATP-dependent RNA helicase HrpB [Rubripirellula amarantea]|uniref:ATP-dependent RNA helicase HrpB n=1 Tax=Rubripirellula amarantea TaxID=2527999 RepID=A0A5C5WTJ3_9BACT|nr:ATP-dependent RNA helicase HrpA [Rubripirellula amarantea]TWT53471.1 ATP-dependent RNA helicase HrpB [Rubripirellula amarantea]
MNSHGPIKPTSPALSAKADPLPAANDNRDVEVKVEFPDELPITAHREQIVELIRSQQVIVVCGETGSGKSTQLPKFCLEAGLGRNRMIGHTQPRRLAARSIATRLAEELSTNLGDQVGYKVRFGDQTSDKTLIKLMTDGILLAETGSDRSLDAYDAIIIDEAHERSLNIDFLMGYLRRLQDKRPDLKIIITSATIDAERFAEHFSKDEVPCPIVNVEGRGYPVELRYLPWEEIVDDETRGYDLSRHVIEAINQLSRSGEGDTLVFLPTERDIREVSHRVAGHYKRLGLTGRVDLLPLYARLPQSQQQQIFSPNGKKRRIIFATNVAESSLTVPGIRYVIDSGTARISRYSSRSKVQRLPIEPISRASANQRAGRCGRVGPGICVRLFSLDDFENREAFTTPEIRRTNLASVVLQMKTLKLGRLEDFPLLDPPRPEAIREGLRTLTELGAIDDRHELTSIGKKLGRMPVDPRVGRIILAADENGVLAEVLPIAAAMEIPDPRDRPPEKQQAADEAHSDFTDSQSDFLSYLRLWRHYETARSDFGRSKLDRTLKKQFLSPTRMREWSDIYRQLREMASQTLGDRKQKRSIGKIRYLDVNDKFVVSADHYEAIHRSLLAGLLSGVALAGDKNQYTGAGGLKLFLWPGSGVFASKPKWIVAAELVETAKTFARTVAKVQPLWIEQVGAHLLKASHYEPHFSGKSGGAFCFENRTLFGLPIVVRRRVPLAPIDPATARELLIETGLTGRELRTNARFFRSNQALATAIETLAAKTRRRDMVIDDYVVAQFYNERLPQDVIDRASLEKYDRNLAVPSWAKSLSSSAAVSAWLADPPPLDKSTDAKATVYMRPDDLIKPELEVLDGDAFPDELVVGSTRLPLKYHFEPGSERDGVNVTIHQAAVSQISDDRLGWLVPGLLHEKIVSLIKSLPKRIRRNLVPASDTATKIVDDLSKVYGQAPFMQTVCEAISRYAEMPVSPTDFQDDKLQSHLDFLVTVVDDEGEAIAEGRSITPLAAKVLKTSSETSSTTAEPVSDVDGEPWSRSKMTTFDIDELPPEVVRTRGGVQVAQYPGFIIDGDSVATTLFPDRSSAETSLGLGCVTLFANAEKKELRGQVRWLPALEQARIKLSGTVSAKDLENALVHLLARIAFVESQPPVRTQAEFDRRRSERGRRIAEATQEVASWLTATADQMFEVRKALESFSGDGRYSSAVNDIRNQLSWLTFPGFLSSVPWAWLVHYPRYFKAIVYRLDKIRSGAASKDAESQAVVAALWSRWEQQLAPLPCSPETQASSEFRWLIEELRVSLFAQPLGTSTKVSPKRCEKLLK